MALPIIHTFQASPSTRKYKLQNGRDDRAFCLVRLFVFDVYRHDFSLKPRVFGEHKRFAAVLDKGVRYGDPNDLATV